MKNMNQNNQNIGNEEELKRAYMELGKAYYEGKFEEPLPELLPLFDWITKLKNPVKQNGKLCLECGNILVDEARFCPNCGHKVV